MVFCDHSGARIRIFFGALAVLLLAPFAPAQAAAADPAPVVWLCGDSVSIHGAPALSRLRPTTEYDVVSGRHVDQLPVCITNRLAEPGPVPDVMVLALGTNPRRKWGEAEFRKSVALIPKSIKVVFVTPYRDPDYPDPRKRAPILLAYGKQMRKIAVSSGQVFLASWYGAVRKDPQRWTYDGCHQTPAGERLWASTVNEAVGRALK
jgi:hypothetical protein